MTPSGTVPCKWCGAETAALGIRECQFCWEIRVRAQGRPGTAKKIVDAILAEEGDS